MSEFKHTPGPWHVIADPMHFDSMSVVVSQDRSAHLGIEGRMVVHVGGWAGITEQEANARLIAVAPELLDALEVCVTSMQDSGYPNSHIAIRHARAAIAKATGKTK